MESSLTKQAVLDLYFVEARARLIDLAAFLDRVERAPGQADYRLAALRAALAEMARQPDGTSERAKAVLVALSDPTTEPVPAAATKGASGAWPGSAS